MREDLLAVLAERVLVADGAMGTMLQAAELTLDDFEGHEGCNEILNATRPDVVRGVHDAYFAVGCDAVETNTFGTNLANLGEYGIADRIGELAEAGARIAREAADFWSTSDQPRFVLGSVGPGTKLPTLGHITYPPLRDAYQLQVAGLLAGGVDAVLIETAQDLLQAKAAIIGARRAMAAAGRRVALIAQVTVELTGTMLLGTEIAAALTALEPLGIDLIGLNCATGPTEMSEHLRYLSRHAHVGLSVMPNAGLPVLDRDGATYPLTPAELADAQDAFTRDYGAMLVGGCCGTTPEHLRQVVERVGGRAVTARRPDAEPAAASLYQSVPFRQDNSVLMVGERTNTNGSKAFREALIDSRWDDVVEIARTATREGAHMIDVCVDYVGRDGTVDMREVTGRYATASTLPVMLDSTEPPVIEAGLECLGGRSVVNSVNFEDGDGPGSRIATVMPIIREHGAAVVALCIDEEGQARTVEWKVRVAERLITYLTGQWGMRESDILIDALTFTLGTGQEESRGDGAATIEAIREIKRRHPDVSTVLGLSNISFGLKPAARVVLNSVFLAECVQAGLDAAIVHASKILPMSRIPDEQREVALDLVHDRRRDGYDPLTRFLDLFEGVEGGSDGPTRAQELAALPLDERLRRRIIDGERTGLEADLDEAMRSRDPLAIINDTLLDGMKTVGDLFGSGQMQLPFVLQSAEVMKAAVAYLEPHMEKSDTRGKGTLVLATVKGDVHDIGKNLVDIILSNNGYTVVNLGIKQPITTILDAAAEHDADAIGMSGLLVKSTVIMKENLAEMNTRGVAATWPVLLGGAALTRAYVERDLAELYEGDVRYARDAFEGLSLMDAVMAAKRGEAPPLADDPGAAQRRARRARTDRIVAARAEARADEPARELPPRSDVAADNPVPVPPFWGDRIVKGIPLADYAAFLDERATFLGQWGLRGARGGEGPSYEELVETEGRPRLRMWLDRIASERMLEAAVVYGYFPCVSKGEDLIVLSGSGAERVRFTFPRQRRDRRLCLADFYRSEESGEVDVAPFMIVTMGRRISEVTAELFAANSYREYLELHGLSVQLTEALTEYWHKRIRSELVLPDGTAAAATDAGELDEVFGQGYRGSRYSFGYPACPDLEQQVQVFELLRPERVGVELSEEFQLVPEQSTSEIIAHHPEAKYFAT
ncbi:methionine synthase [Frankia sp. Cppng1_Ct_nod]|uniref:methionine synthase n=1 Tax=Frankia sp. Cppng1_Ct_nod TaxID=2897162 RepID=UPI0010411041|nr:methionine synthase [Frankia sp. Cppng1_Ct_nod]